MKLKVLSWSKKVTTRSSQFSDGQESPCKKLSAGQGSHHILLNTKFHHHVHKPVTCPYPTFPPYFFNSNFNNILPPQPSMPQILCVLNCFIHYCHFKNTSTLPHIQRTLLYLVIILCYILLMKHEQVINCLSFCFCTNLLTSNESNLCVSLYRTYILTQ